ncbi:MAG: hypothetical protein FWE25_03400 [Lachnospiraceae bacterium]|nr:hypothetical protein [Lachnospiraceae bacterium]
MGCDATKHRKRRKAERKFMYGVFAERGVVKKSSQIGKRPYGNAVYSKDLERG